MKSGRNASGGPEDGHAVGWFNQSETEACGKKVSGRYCRGAKCNMQKRTRAEKRYAVLVV